MYKIYEYTGQDVSIFIKALNEDDALGFLQEKCRNEGLEEPTTYDDLMEIDNERNASGVIAFIDNRIGF